VRVVSLVPSVTETLLDWGVEVAACTRFCEQPRLVQVGGTKDPDLAAIVELTPDLVVVDREENRREDAEALVAAGLRVHVTHVVSVAGDGGVDHMLDDLAGAVGLGGRRRERAAMGAPVQEWATAAVMIWRRPWMALGPATYGSSLLGVLGVRNVVTADEGSYPVLGLDDLAGRAPSFVLLPSEPYPFARRHLAEVEAAVPDARAVLLDGRDLFWWGTRTPGAIVRLRAVLAAPVPPAAHP
jgi:ABC-type Fe3+-hydroxamate transport system substrate-binding protein